MPPWRATHNLTYDAISEHLKINRCRGRTSTGRRCDEKHDGTITDGQLHWSDRRVTRAGIKRFLLLAARATVNEDPHSPTWVTTWRRIMYARNWLAELGFRIGKDEWRLEKAQLRAQLAKDTSAPFNEDERDLRAKAMAWSRG